VLKMFTCQMALCEDISLESGDKTEAVHIHKLALPYLTHTMYDSHCSSHESMHQKPDPDMIISNTIHFDG